MFWPNYVTGTDRVPKPNIAGMPLVVHRFVHDTRTAVGYGMIHRIKAYLVHIFSKSVFGRGARLVKVKRRA